jgi:penicillin G amidase
LAKCLCKGIAPAPGWDAKYDWAGWLPYDQTPSDNGAKGWVSTANQRIHAPDYPHFMGQDWTAPQRFDRIEQLLAAQPQHDAASMQKIQGDVLSLAAVALAPELKKLAQAPLSSDVIKAITQFDGVMRADSAGALILSVWADELARGMIEPRLGEAKFKAMYGKRQFRGTVEQILQNNDAFWCAPKTCPQQSKDALDRALDRIRALQGNDVAQWQWGGVHVARSIHKPLGNKAALAKLFDVTVPTSGDPWTVNVGQYWLNEKKPFENRHAASLRAIYDLADLEQSQFIYQTGQSGLVFSSRYRDMTAQWAGQADSTGSAVAIGYRKLQLKPETFTHSLTLQP